ncbi:MAG: trigger factor [Pseudomonadota bacterium]
MKITQTQEDGLKRVFDVVVSPQEVASRVDDKLIEHGKNVKIPGFRPGHVPLPILRTRFKSSVLPDVLKDLVDAGINQAFTENKVRPAIRPNVDAEQYQNDQDFTFKIDVEVMPEIKPVDLASLDFERLKIDVGDEEIEKTLKDVAKNHKRTKPTAKSHKAKKGDILKIAIQAFIGTEPLEIHSHDELELRLGSEQFDPQMDKALMDVKAGEDHEVTINYSKEARHPDIKGKSVRYEIAVHEILQLSTVKIDDQLATEKGFKDLAELKEQVAEQLRDHFEAASFWHIKRHVLDSLSDKHGFPVPSSLLQQEIESIKAGGGLEDESEDKDKDKDKDKEKTKKEQEKADKKVSDIAERRVRLGLLLAQIGSDHNITVPDDEISEALLDHVRQYPGHEVEVLKAYQKKPELMAQIKAPLLENKVVEFILEQAKVKEKAISVEDFEKEFAKIAN